MKFESKILYKNIILTLNFVSQFIIGSVKKNITFRKVFISTFQFLLIFSVLSQQQNKLVQVPLIFKQNESQKEYFLMHYWSTTSPSSLKKSSDLTERLFVNYIGLLYEVPPSVAVKSLYQMISLFSTDSIVLNNLLKLSEKYFFDPNSPVHNEEFYIPVLQKVLSSGILNSDQRIQPAYQLNLMMKNRVNTHAANFCFTLPNAKELDLYSVESDLLILLFANPECPACKEMLDEINHSKVISDLLTKTRGQLSALKILNIYTDSDFKFWFEYVAFYPGCWINAYDKKQVINKNELYDLKAMPTLYLLDKNKNVMLKDVPFDLLEKELLRIRKK